MFLHDVVCRDGVVPFIREQMV